MPSSSHVTCKHDVQQTFRIAFSCFSFAAPRSPLLSFGEMGMWWKGTWNFSAMCCRGSRIFLNFLVLVNVTKELRPYSIS